MDKNTKMFYCSVDQKIWKIIRTLDKVGNVHTKEPASHQYNSTV